MFLSEAFTRPKVMHRLAKLGYTQSYTYFAWRNTKTELIEYFTELTKDPSREYFRPNVWPNTPDILTEVLQHGGRAAFMTRLVLAATLSANYGVYGPAFENLEHVLRDRPAARSIWIRRSIRSASGPREKPGNLSGVDEDVESDPARQRRAAIGLVTALSTASPTTSCYAFSKTRRVTMPLSLSSIWITARKQSGWVDLDLTALGLKDNAPFIAHDLLTGTRYSWHGRHNYVALDPAVLPAHVLRIEAAQPISEILDARFG